MPLHVYYVSMLLRSFLNRTKIVYTFFPFGVCRSKINRDCFAILYIDMI